jgi:3-hydroxyisobutyrate dehydrogenase
MQIGIAGMGRMGAAMAARLMELGHHVTVWNRSADKTKTIAEAGAAVAASPAELTKNAEIILTILTDAAAIDAVYSGPSGLLGGDVKGKLFIEMSTVQPETEVDVAKKVQAKGASFLDCPVGGSVGPARQGRLIGMAGGDTADFERARPLLEQLCRRVELYGPVGAGASMKLAINLPLMIYWQAFGEALSLCQHLNVDPLRMIDLFSDTSGGTNALKVRGPTIAMMLEGRDPGPTTFDIASSCKDLRTMLAEGKRRGVQLPLIERALACYEEAASKGWAQRDGSMMPVYWSRRGRN